MNSNLPVKKENGLFGRIQKFFSKLFSKEKIEINYEEKFDAQPKNEKEDNIKKQFEESIKVETDNEHINEIKREEFLDEIESNPKLLYDLSVEKLERLEEYYKESIKKQEEKLEKLKKAS
jgi:hypothetical protein